MEYLEECIAWKMRSTRRMAARPDSSALRGEKGDRSRTAIHFRRASG